MVRQAHHDGQPKGRLEILTARGEVLVFEPLPEGADASLEGIAWTLAAFIEEKTVEGMVTPLLMPTDVLEDVTTYRIYGNQLWLETGDGRALVLTARE